MWTKLTLALAAQSYLHEVTQAQTSAEHLTDINPNPLDFSQCIKNHDASSVRNLQDKSYLTPPQKSSFRSIDDQDASESEIQDFTGQFTSDTRFYGIDACYNEETLKLTSFQVIVKHGTSSLLEAMPIQHTTIDTKPDQINSTCRKSRLKSDEYLIDDVTIYTSSQYGIEAIRFEVGEMGQTFGLPSESAIESHYQFTEEDKFVDLAVTVSEDGRVGVRMQSIDQGCVQEMEGQLGDDTGPSGSTRQDADGQIDVESGEDNVEMADSDTVEIKGSEDENREVNEEQAHTDAEITDL